MIIAPPYATSLAGLAPGTFAIPLLPWTVAPIGLTYLGSNRAMFTNIEKKGYGHVISHYLPHVPSARALVAGDLNILETTILHDINAAVTIWQTTPPVAPSDNVLTRIAIGIQLWGGNAGRGAFVQGGGFSKNFNPAAYRNIISLLKSPPPGVPVGIPYPALVSAVNIWKSPSFNQFGVSFATKHLGFWSRAVGMPHLLPIYDKIIAKICMGHSSSNWGHYWHYVEAMHIEVSNINAANPKLAGGYTVGQLERQLFNWANSPAAAYWHR